MKAQLFTADAISASAVMLMAIGLALFIHETVINESDYSYYSSMIDRNAEVLINQVMGNISTDGEINEGFAKQLFSKTYSELSQEFGISYNFSINVVDAGTRNTVSIDSIQLSTGLSYKNPTRLSTAERFAVLNGEYVIVRVRVFE